MFEKKHMSICKTYVRYFDISSVNQGVIIWWLFELFKELELIWQLFDLFELICSEICLVFQMIIWHFPCLDLFDLFVFICCLFDLIIWRLIICVYLYLIICNYLISLIISDYLYAQLFVIIWYLNYSSYLWLFAGSFICDYLRTRLFQLFLLFDVWLLQVIWNAG